MERKEGEGEPLSVGGVTEEPGREPRTEGGLKAETEVDDGERTCRPDPGNGTHASLEGGPVSPEEEADEGPEETEGLQGERQGGATREAVRKDRAGET